MPTLTQLHRALPTLTAITSVILVAVGCALIYLPAGLIVAGTLGITGSVAYQRGTTTTTDRDPA